MYSDGLGTMRYRPRSHVALWPGLCEIFCSDPLNGDNSTEKIKLSPENQVQVSRLQHTRSGVGNSPSINKTAFRS